MIFLSRAFFQIPTFQTRAQYNKSIQCSGTEDEHDDDDDNDDIAY